MSSTAFGSMPANGSSSRMNCGSVASARAISVRRRSPPESASPRVLRTCWMPNSASSSSRRFKRSRRRSPMRLQHGEDVLGRRHAPEDRRLLRQIADAETRAQVHRQLRDVAPAERDAPGIRALKPDNHVEGRRLPRPVRAEQPDDLARLDVQAHAVHHAPPPVALHKVARGQSAAPTATRRSRASRTSAAASPAASMISSVGMKAVNE